MIGRERREEGVNNAGEYGLTRLSVAQRKDHKPVMEGNGRPFAC